ncbi:hypothetical protein TIFTF001_013608 [Ficus carica]|uniref:Secreted protein n=1 Tax=Ficus carica TaxID=3494 RepID=A0AA88A4N6_FICCA|nr:hypothetical protein TIFTF001_013608 [Ficus carica]
MPRSLAFSLLSLICRTAEALTLRLCLVGGMERVGVMENVKDEEDCMNLLCCLGEMEGGKGVRGASTSIVWLEGNEEEDERWMEDLSLWTYHNASYFDGESETMFIIG